MRLYTRDTGEEAGNRAGSALAAPQEDTTMAGYVRAYVEIHGDRSYDVVPTVCPAVDEHTSQGPRCWTCHTDGWQRVCMYFISGCANDNVTERVHPSSVADRGRTIMSRQVRMGVICQRQRGNRPPGC